MFFQKFYVPNKFMKWVAQLVNYRSADIVANGKVISLTKESVHLVLGLPIGPKAFPFDCSAGKVVVLSLFEKNSIPSVLFFANKIIKGETNSDEELIIYFVLVAMNSFLCPNSYNVPSYRYFGIFEDINNLKEYDWCGYILDWLLQSVKSFNRGKSLSTGNARTLGGCLYYLVENLMKDVAEADQDVLSRAFKRSSKARPLNQSNMRDSFEFYWDKYIGLDMGFEQYGFAYLLYRSNLWIE
ncbi:hypothetical protein C2845_PM01G20320 [Panicum miliaceum]|uniref:Aminotransferase-like plant mobile domain-containing protein n=1 Tax=Panicum miliaceum TaxID=4540 RepID=A0A3L6TSP7_PANMI|nr:hypothetical protein C2845_PM01G20320 [Panicum miliaceum]